MSNKKSKLEKPSGSQSDNQNQNNLETEQGMAVTANRLAENLKLLDLTQITQLKLTAHAKKRLKSRFGIAKPEQMINWALEKIHGGHAVQVDVIAKQLRVKIQNNEIMLIVNVIDNSLITAYPFVSASTTANSASKSKPAPLAVLAADDTYKDLMTYLRKPIEGYLALQERGLVSHLDVMLNNLLATTLAYDSSPTGHLNLAELESEIDELKRLVVGYKEKTAKIANTFLPEEQVENDDKSIDQN